MTFTEVERATAVETIVRRIGEAIGSGVLAPGERLPPEPELAAQLGVAPMTLRQALAVLRDAGFVETRRGRNGGSFVRADAAHALAAQAEPPSPRELRELTDWRRAISGEAVALAAVRAPAGARRRVAELADAVERAVGTFAAFRAADARLHRRIAELSGSARLLAAEATLQAELGEILALVPGPELARSASHAGHAPIVAALAAGDPTAARDALERHVESTHDWIVGLRLGRLGRT